MHLRIAATSDLHAALRAYDYFADRPRPGIGMTRIATLLQRARAEAENCLFVDNGDLLQGNPLADAAAAQPDTANPFVAEMNALGLDAATLGNHDFNYGLDYLGRALGQARYPVVLCNIVRALGPDPTADTPFLPPWTVLEREVRDGSGAAHRLRIGVIGVAPPQVVEWDADSIGGTLRSRPVLQAATAHLRDLRATGVDLVVMLSHGGMGLQGEGPENASVALAALDGVDVVIMGHVHKTFPTPHAPQDLVDAVDMEQGTLHGKPAVMPGERGSHLGVIDLLLEHTADGRWSVRKNEAALRPVACRNAQGRVIPLVPEDPDSTVRTQGVHDRAVLFNRTVVARTKAPLNSYFAFVGHDSASLAVTAALRHAAARHARQAGFGDLPILAAGAPFMAGGQAGPDHYTDVAAGGVTLRDISDLYLFPDRITLLRVTGAEVRAWLERSAAAFLTVRPGQRDAPLLDPTMPSYHFDLIDGLTYRIDLTQPPGYTTAGNKLPGTARRIVDLAFQGQPVRDDDRFLVATNNYRAGGGGAFPGTGPGKAALSLPDHIPDLVRRYLADPPHGAEPRQQVWSFAPMPGTSVVFRTGPRALRHLHRLNGMPVEPCGTDDSGFALLRLWL